MRQGATAKTSATTGDAVPDVRWRRQRRWWPPGRRRGGRRKGAAPLPGSGHPGERTRSVVMLPDGMPMQMVHEPSLIRVEKDQTR